LSKVLGRGGVGAKGGGPFVSGAFLYLYILLFKKKINLLGRFQLSVESILQWLWFCFTSFSGWLKNTHHFLNQY